MGFELMDNEPWHTPMRTAVLSGDFDAVRDLIASVPGIVNRPTPSGSLPLIYAIACDAGPAAAVEMTRLLLSNGADVNQTDILGWTPLASLLIDTNNSHRNSV